MKFKILILLNIVLLAVAAFLFYRSWSLKQDVQFANQRFQSAADSVQYYRYVSKGDSLMIAEDFEGAMEYFRRAENIFGQENLTQEMQELAEGVRTKSANIDRLRNRVIEMQDEMQARKDSLEEELQERDSLMKVSRSEIRLYSYRNELLRDSLSGLQAAYQEIESRDESVGKAEFEVDSGVKVYYAGDLKDGKAHGEGYGLFASGGIYEGEWKNNKRHGEGKYIWKDGNVYIGEYQDDKRHGTGTYYFTSGEKYVGEWEDNKRSGQGTLYGEEGEVVLKGQWEDDQIAQVESTGGYK